MALLDNFLRLERGELKKRDARRLKAFLTFQPNAESVVWVYRERRSTGELWLPRGVLDMCPDYVSVRDKRSFPKLPKLDTKIILDYQDSEKSFYGQVDCVTEMFTHKQGVIHRQPGTGKTEIALFFIAQVGSRSLVIVHTDDLLQQWKERAELMVPGIEIGVIGRGEYSIGQLTLATIQTINKRNFSSKFWRQFGVTILDECHHAPAQTFDRALAHSTSRYRFGLSASKTRADNMQMLVRYNIGPVIHELEFDSPVPVYVKKVSTNFRAGKNGAMVGPLWLRRRRWQTMIKMLVNDPRRNYLIARAVAKELDNGRSVLLLSRRIEHLQNLKKALSRFGHDSEILAAQLMSKPERKKRVQDFRDGKVKCILATQLADEGLDVPILSCVCLAFPGKHSDLIMQQVGRALRKYGRKTSAVVIDIVDPNVKTLRSQWHHRRRAYLGWGFSLKNDPVNLVPRKVRRMVYGRIR